MLHGQGRRICFPFQALISLFLTHMADDFLPARTIAVLHQHLVARSSENVSPLWSRRENRTPREKGAMGEEG